MNSLYLSPPTTQQNPDSAITDTALEPQANFSFEDTHGQEQKSSSKMNFENASQGLLSSVNGFGSNDLSFSRDLLDGTDDQPNSGTFGNSPTSAWPDGGSALNHMCTVPNASLQSHILLDRSNSVQQRFGQITPPDEGSSDMPSSKFEDPVEHASNAEKLKPGKSERARNAANQRHAKTKKQRRDSRQSMGSALSDGNDTEDKREKYREKNRVAAAKCRAKKKTNIETIEERHRDLNAMNTVLKKQVQELRGELTGLRTQALIHQDCSCPISRYNMNQAKRMTMGADARNSPAAYDEFSSMQSPGNFGGDRGFSMSNLGSGDPPIMGMSAQAHQFPHSSDFAFASPEEMLEMQQGNQFGDFMQSGCGGPMDFSQQ